LLFFEKARFNASGMILDQITWALPQQTVILTKQSLKIFIRTWASPQDNIYSSTKDLHVKQKN